MKHTGRRLTMFCGVLLLLLRTASAAPLPDHLTLTYKVMLGSATLGRLVTELSKVGDGYQVQARTRAEGLAAIILGGTVHETCSFQTGQNGLRPTHFERSQRGFVSDTKHTAQFDWQKKRIIFSDGTPEAIPDGYITDNCSVPYAYMRDGQDGFQKRTLHIVGYNRVRHFDLVGLRRETLKIPLGEFETIRVEHTRQGKDRQFIVWLAVRHNNLPIKIMEKRSSRTTTMVAEKFEGLP